MKKVNVETTSGNYEVRIGSGLLERAGLWIRELGYIGSRAVIISDDNVYNIHVMPLRSGLVNAGFDVTDIVMPPGEEHKTLETAATLYGQMAEAYTERTTPVFALGGGVIGDIAGFVAATYLRGLPLVQVPTTLLAQADSSVGGKTAVDFRGFKNIVGAFYQPRLVIADIDTFRTLPDIEYINGLGEVIKHAAIRNALFFEFLEKNMASILAKENNLLQAVIAENVRIKADIVSKDERETGLREVLNYGHTIGHAVETVSGFKLKHGQAVALGMVAAARISSKMGVLSPTDTARLEDLVAAAGLPVHFPDVDRKAIVEAMKHDKKVRLDRIRFVLLRSLGHAFLSEDVDMSLVEEVLCGWG